MPPLTIEVIAAIVTGILVPLFGGVAWVWKSIGAKIKEGQKATEARLDEMAAERQRLLNEIKTDEKNLEDRLTLLERNSVSKEDHNNNMAAIHRSMDAVALALRETSATLTSRIDMVLFEVGRKNNAKSE